MIQERLLLWELKGDDSGVSSSYVDFPHICIAGMAEKEKGTNPNLKTQIYRK